MPGQGLSGAIDLGGSKIFSAIVDSADHVLGEDLRATNAGQGQDAVIGRLVTSLEAAASAAGVAVGELLGVGVVAPGPADPYTGHVFNPPNLPGWGDVALGPILSERLALPVLLENDANAAALGEYVAGAGRGAEVLIYVTISTGIGGGFVFGGRLFRGVSGSAGEIGHMIVRPDGPRCGCGNQGCLEAVASGTAIGREGRRALSEGRAPVLRRIVSAANEQVTAAQIAEAAATGDEDARAILQDAAVGLGTGLGNLVNLLNPDVIVIGGGVAHIGPALLEPAAVVMRAVAFASAVARVQLRAATLPYGAIQGVAAIARQGQSSTRLPPQRSSLTQGG